MVTVPSSSLTMLLLLLSFPAVLLEVTSAFAFSHSTSPFSDVLVRRSANTAASQQRRIAVAGAGRLSSSSSIQSSASDTGESQQQEEGQPKVRIVECPCNERDMPFYALGVNLANQVNGATSPKLQEILDDHEMSVAIKGFTEHLTGKSPSEIIPNIMQNFGPTINQILQQRTEEMVSKIKKEGDEFVANFLQESAGAVTTGSGLVYDETAAGSGQAPTPESTVEVHYHGTLADGTVFDSSMDRGQTVTLPLPNAIPGWREGVTLMKEGGRATLVIPSDLAYGEMGSPPVIPPCATLKFDIELIKVL